MIEIENAQVYGFDAAIRGMRNPFNSWDRSDSEGGNIGMNDYALMIHLIDAGTDHSKFMRFITVDFDLVAPLYFWKQIDTYKVGTVRNSCSTMHTLMHRPLRWDDFSAEGLTLQGKNALSDTIGVLNKAIESDNFSDAVALLPECYNQRATMHMNYAVLRSIYHARKNHKLAEWKTFCEWIESLPNASLITRRKTNTVASP